MIITLEYAAKLAPSRHARVNAILQGLGLASIVLASMVALAFEPLACGCESGPVAKQKMTEAAVGPNGPIVSAIGMFKFDVGHVPAHLGDLISPPDDPVDARKWKSAYLGDPSGLIDPWGRPFQYQMSTAAAASRSRDFRLWSLGPDGINATPDDIRGR